MTRRGMARGWRGRAIGLLLAAAALAGCGVGARGAPVAAGPVAPVADEPLPSDPALVRGTLDNGLTYLIRKHGNPAGRVSMWLHVASGSLNETEETRGLAHYLEHMAFNGSANFPPGSVVPFFQSLGLTFGRDQNAFTSFEQTTYTLTLPDPAPETLGKGLLFLSDVATRLSLAPAEVDSERQIILEEKRTRAGARQRVQDYLYERLAPESTFGRRLPIGTEQAIRLVTAQDLREYYARWYVPSNITVIVVGDAEPELVAPLIRQYFGDAPALRRPPDREVGVRPQSRTRAIIAVDPELTQADVSILRVEPPRPPTATVRELRRDLVEAMGTWAFNRRMSALLAEGRAAFLEAEASARQHTRAIRMISAEASGKPGAWRAMLRDLGAELQRARLHGFSEREVEDGRTALVAQAEEATQQEGTLPARALLRRINGAVARQEPVMSAAQRLALLRRLLPGITAREVSDAFAAAFDPTHVTFIAELPAGGDVPTEAELIALGRVALDVEPEKPTEAARAASLLDALPPGGTVVETVEHAPSGVVSAWLDNGVRVHHRFMDQRRSEASVVITLAGGEIQETAVSRGITDAAALGWTRPATSRRSSTQIRDLMTGKKVRVRAASHADTLTLTVSGSPTDLETGLQLAYLLLTDPVIEPAALAQWKESETREIAARKVQAGGVLREAIAQALYPPDEPRTRPLEVEDVRRITLAAAQAWLRQIIVEAPIEVAVVGDIDRATALRLVERYLGALAPRDRIGPKTWRELRAMPRPKGPIRVERTIDVKTPQSVVLDGFFGTDAQNLRDARRLTVAARILTTRMSRVIREERQLVYSIGAASQPASEYPGFGLFYARAPTDPAKGEALVAALDEMYGAFAKDGPTETEMAVARGQIRNILDEGMKDPDFWLSRLATLDYRGLQLADIVEAPAEYARLGADEVREVFARYFVPEGRFRFVITPRDPGGKAGAAAPQGQPG